MSEWFEIRVGRGAVQFSAAHFLVFGPDSAESLHGHDFHVEVAVRGQLCEPGWVMDFVALQQLLAEIVGPLNHKVLLPANSPWLRVEPTESGMVQASLGKSCFNFPANGCCLLPVGNVTAELLAEYLGRKLLHCLEKNGHSHIERLCVELFETPHYSARWVYEWPKPES